MVDQVGKLKEVNRRERPEARLQNQESRVIFIDVARHNVRVDVPVNHGPELVSDLDDKALKVDDRLPDCDRRGRRWSWESWQSCSHA